MEKLFEKLNELMSKYPKIKLMDLEKLLLDEDIVLVLDQLLENKYLNFKDIEHYSINSLTSEIIMMYAEMNNLEIPNMIESDEQDLNALYLYYKDIKRGKVLTKKEQYELITKAQNGDLSARNEMIERNLRLVIPRAQYYRYNFASINIDILDLIQAGNLGLFKAIEKFDITKGYYFSTYAVYWIRQSIMAEIRNTAKPIRIPVGIQQQIRKMLKIEKEYFDKNNKQMEMSELSKQMDLPIEEIEHLKKSNSLDTIYSIIYSSEGEELDILDDYSIPETKSVEEKVIEKQRTKDLINFLNDAEDIKLITENQKNIIIEYYGLGRSSSKSYEEVAEILGGFRQSKEESHKRALQKLRDWPNKKFIKDYYK